jgi:hypothetical protein
MKHFASEEFVDGNCLCLHADPAHRLTLHIRDLSAREKAIHAQLAALNEEDGDVF